jgi:hypothetical protein
VLLKKDKYYWTESICNNYKLVAVAFGFGPKIAAEIFAIQNEIQLKEWHGSSSENKPNDEHLCLLNFGVIDYHCTSKLKIWIDCLMWLRKSLPKEILDYDLILIENFFPISQGLESVLKNYKFISPLIDYKGLTKKLLIEGRKEFSILVSFGGIETPFTTRHIAFTIPEITLELILEYLENSCLPLKVNFCLPANMIPFIEQKSNSPLINFISPTKEEYLALLRNANLVILQPGLYGPFEAFLLNKEILFTPPFSYTQIMQMREFISNNFYPITYSGKFIIEKIYFSDNDIHLEEKGIFDQLDNVFKTYYTDIKDLMKLDFNLSEKCYISNSTEKSNMFINIFMTNIFKTGDFILKNYVNEQVKFL